MDFSMIYMYNTIEVITLEILKADIIYLKSGSFCTEANEGVKHIKILPYLSVVQATEGSYDISLGNDTAKQTGEGGFFIAPSHIKQTIVHHVNPESKKMSARWIFIDVQINDSFPLDKLYRFPVVITDDLKNVLNELFNDFFQANDVFRKYSVCYKILETILKRSEQENLISDSGITSALGYMIQNYSKQIRINKLAQIARTSESNFYAAFKKQFGVSPISYINHYRLSLAAEKLIQSDASINEIACSVGINDSLYFSKLFKKEYNMSPKEYRLMYKK